MNRKVIILLLITLIVFGCAISFMGCSKRDYTFSIPNDTNGEVNNDLKDYLSKKKDGISLVENNNSVYVVVYPHNAADSLKQAAQFLADSLKNMINSENQIKVFDDNSEIGAVGSFISVGDTKMSADINLDEVLDDGYKIYSDSKSLYIKGKDDEGSKNGVYDFLESELGCMFVRADYNYIPKYKDIYLPKYDKVVNPSIAWRKVYQYEAIQNAWYDRLKLNGSGIDENGNGIEYYNQWGTWCHSSFDFCSPEEYFDSHPEYFALVNGKRGYEATVRGQKIISHLCYTNSDVYEIVKANLIQRIEQNPDKKYWDISIMDTWCPMCECENCKAINDECGSGIGTIITFLNKLSDDLKDDYPDIVLSTLAYQDCQTVPKNIKCADNVCIKVCAFPGSQSYPYGKEGSKESDNISAQIEGWGKVCNNLFIWDYVVNFSNLLLPFPNYSVQKENIDFYINNNIKAVFHQGSREKNDEFASMRTYLLSRQLWDKDIDIEKLASRYIDVNYKNAAPYIKEYINTMEEELTRSKIDLSIYDSASKHSNGYLSTKNVEKYLELTNHALDVVDGVEKEQVELIRINALYAKTVENSWDISGKNAAYAELVSLAEKYQIEKYAEWASFDEYKDITYNKHIVLIKLYISLTVIGAVAFVILVVLLIKFWPKIISKKKKMNN